MSPHFTTSEAIFQKATVSTKPKAILEVARAFEALGATDKAWQLYNRAYMLRHRPNQFGFGASVRGTPIAGTDGAVIPPGRYWLNIPKYNTDVKRSKWLNFTMDHPEVKEEKREYSGTADNLIMTVFFIIPPTANNYGLPGVHFPTTILGFPTIADASVKSAADTIKRPSPMTSLEALAETPALLGQGIQSGVQYTAETVGKAAKGVTEGLGLSNTTLVVMGVGLVVGLVLLNRLMIPRLPI